MRKRWNNVLPGDIIWIHSGLCRGILPRSAKVVFNNHKLGEIVLEGGESFRPTYYSHSEVSFYDKKHHAFIYKEVFLKDLRETIEEASDPRLREVWKIIIKEYE